MLLSLNNAFANHSKTITISSGNPHATFFRIATSICTVFNKYYSAQGYKCKALASKGAVDNFKKVTNYSVDFGIIKPIRQYSSFLNQRLIKRAENSTLSVAKLHNELLSVLVNSDLDIKSLEDLNGKIVSIGAEGSASRLFTKEYFEEYGIKPKKTVNLNAKDSFADICSGKIHAWIYFIGHPNVNYEKTLQNCNTHLIGLQKISIKKYLAITEFFQEGAIKVKYYPKSLKKDIPTISSPAILITNSNVEKKRIDMIRDILFNKRDELNAINPVFPDMNLVDLYKYETEDLLNTEEEY
jgi:TRAP transporter TAXI family solute receptor